MMKDLVFSPLDFSYLEEPNDDTLWQVTYKIHEEFSSVFEILKCFPEKIDNNLSITCADVFPLRKWESLFDELNLILKFDFPFAKEYVMFENDKIVFSATITAMDLSSFENEIKINYKFGRLFLDDMDLEFRGNMHPEKFYNRMIESVDLSDPKFSKSIDYTVFLVMIEQLCYRCLQYEKNIEWKII